MNFNELNLNEKILKSLEKNNFTSATDIQEKVIPLFLENKNVFGLSSTGTGKTASFVLPILEKIDTNNRRPQVIIMAPTRELALQIIDQIKLFSTYVEHLKTVAIIGGARMDDQIRRIKQSQIIVGTPGRIKDHIDRKTLKFDCITTIILDEADEMLKMGFKSEIDSIFNNIKNKIQIGCYSATANSKVMSVVNDYMNDYEIVKINNQIKVNDNIKNTFVFTKGVSKEELILKVFEEHKPKKVIIFTNTKSNTDVIQKNLRTVGIKSEVINGDKKQSQRSKTIKMFKNDEVSVLVATDVVARGIDVQGVDYVINYDISMEDEHFIHRIGRTGRNSEKGSSISFVHNGKVLSQLKNIQNKYNLTIDEVHHTVYGLEAKKGNRDDKEDRGSRRGSRNGDKSFRNRESRNSSGRRSESSFSGSGRGERSFSGRGRRNDNDQRSGESRNDSSRNRNNKNSKHKTTKELNNDVTKQLDQYLKEYEMRKNGKKHSSKKW